MLPWDFIDGGDAGRLKREYLRAFSGELQGEGETQ